MSRSSLRASCRRVGCLLPFALMTTSLLLTAVTATASNSTLPVLPASILKHVKIRFRARDDRPHHELNRIFIELSAPRTVTASIRCVGCYRNSPGTHAFVAPSKMKKLIYPPNAIFDVEIKKHNYIDFYLELGKPIGRKPIRRVLCLAPSSKTPAPCSQFEKPAYKPLIITPPTVTNPTPVTAKPVEAPPPIKEEPPPANPELITSYDGTQGDVAPSDGAFDTAEQAFYAASNTITFLGVSIANPNLPVGPDGSDTVQIRLCETAGCAGTVLASVEPHVNNYGLTGAKIGKVTVNPDVSYHLVWKAPADGHGASWLTFSHGEEAETLIQGYDEAEKVPHPDERAVTSNDGSWLATAPYSASFETAHQAFRAASNTITTAGIVLGNPALPRYVQSNTQTVLLRLCETPECANGALAEANALVFNYGITEASLGAVHVSEGATYYLNWQAPEKVDGESWLAYWLGSGPTLPQATQLQALVKGYDRGAPNTPVYHTEQEAAFGANTFADPYNASEEGEPIKPETYVEVSCKLYAPQIESVDPQGYWYRMHSAPWDDRYYAAANTFWNGVLPADAFEPIFTDYAVPTCPG